MKIVLAPDSFKRSLDAPAVAEALHRGLREQIPTADIHCVPIADGGEGSLDVVMAAGGERVASTVLDSDSASIRAEFGLMENRTAAFVEIAQACGLQQSTPGAQDVLRATSYGVGQLIAAALDHDVSRLVIGLGGSATNDGGGGMLQALGARFFDQQGALIDTPLTGGLIGEVADIDLGRLDSRIDGCEILIASDVDNPLLGNDGATYTFGAQKGADDATLALLEQNLCSMYDILEQRVDFSVRSDAGAGAAGGIGAALRACAGATFRNGFDLISELIGFRGYLDRADLVVTGEGRLDQQTLSGKAPLGVSRICRTLDIPVIAVCGSMASELDEAFSDHFAAIEIALTEPVSEAAAMMNARQNLYRAGARIGRWLQLREALAATSH